MRAVALMLFGAFLLVAAGAVAFLVWLAYHHCLAGFCQW
jgi:hypothetical protein